MSLVFAALLVLIATGAYLWVSFYEVPAGKFAIRNFFGELYGVSRAGPSLFWKWLVKPILLPVDFIELEFPNIEAYTTEGKSSTGNLIHQTNLDLQNISVRFKLRDDLGSIAHLMRNFGGSPMSEESFRTNLQTFLNEPVSAVLIKTVSTMDYVTVRTDREKLSREVAAKVKEILSEDDVCLVDEKSISVVVGKVKLPDQLEEAIRAAAIALQKKAGVVTDAEAARDKITLEGEGHANALRSKREAIGENPNLAGIMAMIELAQGPNNNTVVVSPSIADSIGNFGGSSSDTNASQSLQKATSGGNPDSVNKVAHDNKVPQQLVRAIHAYEAAGMDMEMIITELEQSDPADAMMLRAMLMKQGIRTLKGFAVREILKRLPQKQLRDIGLFDAFVQKGKQ